MSWKPVPRFAKCGTSQAPSLHFSFTAWWTGTGILTEVTRKRKPKGKRQLAHDKILVLKYSEEARAWKMHDNKTCPRWSKCFKCELLHLLWEEPTGEETAYCQSLQLEDNRIINKINPVYFWSTFKRSDFQSAGEYHYLDKLLDKAGVLVKTDQMLTEKWNTEDTQQGETKASFCLQTRESALPDPIDRTYLPRQLSCFFDQQRDKGF